jgi:tetratricopeptide (TPR) repeat protein
MPSTPPPSSAPLDLGHALSKAYGHWNAGQSDQAEQWCQRVLVVWPGQADALHLMGLMAHAFGNLDVAIAHLRQACLAPRAPAAYSSNLAEMCRQRGLLVEGETAARRAVALDPNLIEGWNNLGILLQEAGKFAESRVALERVVASRPQWAEAHNNLGNTCKRLGLLDEAQRRYEQAIALRGDYAEAHSNLSNLLVDRGDYVAAEESARRAIEYNPQLVDAYLNLANSQCSRQRYVEALRWLDALAGFAPIHQGGLSARARTLLRLDRLPEALNCAQRAVTVAPQSSEAHNCAGQVLQALGRHQEAVAEFDRAIALPGAELEDAMINRAVAFMEAGRNQEANAAYDAVERAFPQSMRAVLARSELKRYKAEDAEIPRLESCVTQPSKHTFTDGLAAHFALGKMYLDAGNTPKAFEHLHKGNRLKRGTYDFDIALTEKWIRGFEQVFTPTLLTRLAGVGDPSAMPLFIIGMPRSGTSLIEQILASHPAVHGAGELPFLRMIVEGLGGYPEVVGKLAPQDLAALGQRYVQAVTPLSNRVHVVDKMPANFLYAGLAHLALPNARLIHCRRNALDTCVSCYSKLFSSEQLFTYDLGELGRFQRAYERLMGHWRKVLPPERFIDIDYEAVVENLEGEARRLLEWLGLPWNEACLRFHETERVVRTASLVQVRQPIYRSSMGRWRKYCEHLQPLLAALEIEVA